MKKPTYLDLDKEMSKAFRDAELKPGVFSSMREDILQEIEHRLGTANRRYQAAKKKGAH